MADSAAGGADRRRVVEALNRVLVSATFASAPRSRDLLAFVVTETIDGRGDRLNQRLVARVALGRPTTIDTRTDASARVQARRLRQLLDRYYATEGTGDVLRIAIPVGQYAASFLLVERLPDAAERPSSRRSNSAPAIAVVQLRSSSTGLPRRIAVGLTESIVHALSTCPGIQVVGPLAPEPGSLAPSASVIERAAADFVLHGGVVRGDDDVRVTWHLGAAGSNSLVWSQSFQRGADEFTGFGAEDDITRQVVAAIGDFSGVVLRSPPEPSTGRQSVMAEALRSYYLFIDEVDPELRPQVIVELSEALRVEPGNAHVAACLAFVFAVEVLQHGVAAADAIRRAEEYARLAVRIDSREPTAHNVLGIVALASGDLAAAQQCAEAALRVAPMHTETIYIAGAVIAGVDWDRGIALIRHAVGTDPFGPTPRRIWLATDALLHGDSSTALAEASLVHQPGYVYGHIVRAICYYRMGLDGLATTELQRIVAIDPSFFDHARGVLASVPTVPQFVADFLVDHLLLIDNPS